MGTVMTVPSKSVAGRKQLVEQVPEPSFEHLDLGLGHRHVLGPIVRDGPGRLVLRCRAANAASRWARIVVEIAGQSIRIDGILSSGFASASHDRSFAPPLRQKNGRSASDATPRPPSLWRRERPRSQLALPA